MSAATAFYALNVTPLLTDSALRERAYDTVCEARRKKARRYRRQEDEALSLGAGLLLRYACLQAGVPLPTEEQTHPSGKPRTEGLEYNLSHSGEWAVCAVSECPIGCDVEKKDAAHVAAVARAFPAQEQAYLAAAADEEERVDRFFRLWTRKESLQKSAAEGARLSPAVCVAAPDGGHAADTEPEAAFYEYDELTGYACTLCLAHGGARPPLQVLSVTELL